MCRPTFSIEEYVFLKSFTPTSLEDQHVDINLCCYTTWDSELGPQHAFTRAGYLAPAKLGTTLDYSPLLNSELTSF